jgi:predicted ATP-grasp superfamily ATP-dependent carboligase
MLSAILTDLGRVPGVEVVTLLSPYANVPRAGTRCRVIRTAEEEAAFRDLARSADYTLVIAPELDDLLLTRCRWVEGSGGRLLGPSPAAVQLTGDKLALSQHLRQQEIPTPACLPVVPGIPMCPLPFPAVCKPCCGAGSLATFLVRNAEQWQRYLESGRAEGWSGANLVQPFVPGQAASAAFLIGPSQSVALAPATQELSADGRFRYCGGRMPLPSPQAERIVSLAGRAVQAVPGLRGYVGVDVVLGDAADGNRDWVIEINPRLTTSYAGLRALARTNLADAMLRAVLGKEIPHLAWSDGPVRFRPDGTVEGK